LIYEANINKQHVYAIVSQQKAHISFYWLYVT